MDAAAEIGRNPASKFQIQPELARPNSQARTGIGSYSFSLLADHEQDCQPYPVDPYSAIWDGDDLTYISTPRLDLVISYSYSRASPLSRFLRYRL